MYIVHVVLTNSVDKLTLSDAYSNHMRLIFLAWHISVSEISN